MKKFYITTPIFYVNSQPHLGHAYSVVLADVIARYQRSLNKKVFFLTGTDEHGLKLKKAANDSGLEMKKFINFNARRFKKLFKYLAITNSDFIRTTNKRKHWPGVRRLWKEMAKRGDIYKAKYKGLYCLGCEAFITEKDLKDGRCIYHDQKPDLIEEENYFFRLSKYGEQIKEAIEKREMLILPSFRKKEILNFLNQGLADVSFSRPSKNIQWGIPVPGDPSQMIYVWVDALTNYVSALGYGRRQKNRINFEKFWPADVHILGKDITRFHILIWPAMLISANLPLPKAFLVHGFLLSGGRKMSKSLGNVFDPFKIIEEYGADALRYYFCREISPFEDGDFTEEKFKDVYNADLANGLGNYVSRVFKMVFSYFNGFIERPDELLLSEFPLKKRGKEWFAVSYVFEHFIWKDYKKFMDNYEINKALNLVWSALSMLDKYIQDYQPFKMINENKKKTSAVLWNLLYGLAEISWLASPFVPFVCQKIQNALHLAEERNRRLGSFKIKPLPILFARKD